MYYNSSLFPGKEFESSGHISILVSPPSLKLLVPGQQGCQQLSEAWQSKSVLNHHRHKHVVWCTAAAFSGVKRAGIHKIHLHPAVTTRRFFHSVAKITQWDIFYFHKFFWNVITLSLIMISAKYNWIHPSAKPTISSLICMVNKSISRGILSKQNICVVAGLSSLNSGVNTYNITIQAWG